MLQLLQKILIVMVMLGLIFIVSVIIAAWRLGAFAPVQVSSLEREPLYIVTTLEPETPAQLQAQIAAVGSYLAGQGRQALLPAGVFYSNPLSDRDGNTAEAAGGWLVRDSVAVDSAHLLLVTPRQTIFKTILKINPLIARSKAYPVLGSWIERQGYRPDPAGLVLELYRSADSLEIQIPVIKTGPDSLSHH